MKAKHVLVPILVALLLAAGATAQSARATKANDLTGAWKYSAGGAEGDPLPPFIGLMAFARGGVLMESGQGEVNEPTSTPGYGAWEKTGPRTYATTFLHIWYRPDNSLIGILKVRLSITLDETGTQFDGVGPYSVTDPDGNVLISGQATAHGERITVEPVE